MDDEEKYRRRNEIIPDIPATSIEILTKQLNEAAAQGYKALFTIDVQDGHSAVIMEHE
jgi:hypothetical protein